MSIRANTICVAALTNRKPLIYKGFRDIVKPPEGEIPATYPQTGQPHHEPNRYHYYTQRREKTQCYLLDTKPIGTTDIII